MIDIKGPEANAFFNSKRCRYLDVEEILQAVSKALHRVEDSIQNTEDEFADHITVFLMSCILDDLSKLVLFGPKGMERKDLKFSHLRRQSELEDMWDFSSDLSTIMVKSNKSRFESLQNVYQKRNNKVAHTCIPYSCARIDVIYNDLKSLCKEIGIFLELNLGGGDQ